jgi:hypothetical protein
MKERGLAGKSLAGDEVTTDTGEPVLDDECCFLRAERGSS